MDAKIKIGKTRPIATDYSGLGWYDWFVPITANGHLIGIRYKMDRSEGNSWPQNERYYYLYNEDDDPDTIYVSSVELAFMWAEIVANELSPEEEMMIRKSLGEIA